MLIYIIWLIILCHFLRISNVKRGRQKYQCYLGISRKLTCSGATWQKFEILSFTACPIGFSLRHTIRSGDSPRPLSSLTLAWVGFVLGSPVVRGWTTHKQFGSMSLCADSSDRRKKQMLSVIILYKFTLNLNYTSYCHLKITKRNMQYHSSHNSQFKDVWKKNYKTTKIKYKPDHFIL
jgi:hypothetical protein